MKIYCSERYYTDITYCDYLAFTPDKIIKAPPLPAFRIQLVKPLEVLKYDELKEYFDSLL